MDPFNHTCGKYFSATDTDIYYETCGNVNGPAMLLLHGGFGSMEDFNSILPSLLDTYYIIGVDSRGHGKSRLGTKELTYEQLQKDVEELAQFLNLTTFHIIGLSDGGITAYRLAIFSSLHIQKLITIGSRWNVNDALRTEKLFLSMTPKSWTEKFPETVALYKQLNPDDNFDKLFLNVISMWLDKKGSGYPNEQVRKITNELMIVRGDTDHLTTRESTTALADLVTDGILLNIPFAGHVAFTDQPVIFNIALQQFLSK